jgi:hypothetical protein
MMPPKAGSFRRLRRFANGVLEGVKGAFSAEGIAAEILNAILLLADKGAARDTIRTIQFKFMKAGFAKGVAAGVMGWTTDEVESTLMNRVTDFRVQDLGDPAHRSVGPRIARSWARLQFVRMGVKPAIMR